MNFKKVFISELKPAAYNPRKDLQPSDPEYQHIKKSIEEFGYVDPVIVNSDYTVIGGHQRLKVLKELGHAQIDVVVVDIPKNKEKALNVALNKITGEWDDARLVSLLHEIKADGMLEFTGFDDAEFQSLLNDLNNPEIPGASVEQAKQKLTEKFIVPPFSVLDTRQGYWQQRKAYWIALGIKSELGRGGAILFASETASDMHFYHKKRELEQQHGSQITTPNARKQMLENGVSQRSHAASKGV